MSLRYGHVIGHWSNDFKYINSVWLFLDSKIIKNLYPSMFKDPTKTCPYLKPIGTLLLPPLFSKIYRTKGSPYRHFLCSDPWAKYGGDNYKILYWGYNNSPLEIHCDSILTRSCWIVRKSTLLYVGINEVFQFPVVIFPCKTKIQDRAGILVLVRVSWVMSSTIYQRLHILCRLNVPTYLFTITQVIEIVVVRETYYAYNVSSTLYACLRNLFVSY